MLTVLPNGTKHCFSKFYCKSEETHAATSLQIIHALVKCLLFYFNVLLELRLAIIFFFAFFFSLSLLLHQLSLPRFF